MTRRWLLRLLAIGFGLALLGVAEIGLRLAGIGGKPPLLRTFGAPRETAAGPAQLYEVNPSLAELFFSRRTRGELVTGSHPRELIELPKPPGTVRVLFLGASTVEGFPMPRNLTAARFLEAMLDRALPGDAEVVNLGVAAVASFPVRKIAELAIRRCDPDLIIVDTGHNEFFGASGLASFQFMGRSLGRMGLTYQLRQLGLVQALDSTLAWLEPAPPDAQTRDLIEIMAAVEQIEPGGELHSRARENLTANLAAIVRHAREAGVPVVLTTLVSNERGVAPLASSHIDLAAEELAPWQRSRERARQLLRDRGAAAALVELRRVSERAPRHAGAAFDYARALEAAGRAPEAAEQYRRARDLDAMPWRASTAANTAIRELSAREAIALADVEAVFRETSAGATGWRLFVDHVHPSLEGQALLAKAIFDAIVVHRLLPLGAVEQPGWRQAAAELGAHPLEQYVLVHKMSTLFTKPPMSANNENAARRFRRALRVIESEADPIEREAIVLWARFSREAGFALPISFLAGSVALERGEPGRAGIYLHAAVENALELSDERCAAQLLWLLSSLAAEDSEERLVTVRERLLAEAEWVAELPGQPSALQAKSLAGLLALNGQPERSRHFAAIARELGPDSPSWMRTYLSRLPSAEELSGRMALQGPPSGPEALDYVDRVRSSGRLARGLPHRGQPSTISP